MATTLARQIQRAGTTAEWASVNPILAAGEFGVDRTLNRAKLGDGATPWSSLGWTTLSTDEVASMLSAAALIGSATGANDAVMAAVAADPESAFSIEQRATIAEIVDAAITPADTPLEARRAEVIARAFAPPPPQDYPTISFVPWDSGILSANTRYRAAASGAAANMTTDTAFRYDGTPALNSAFTEYVDCDYIPGGSSQAARYAYQVETLTSSANSYLWIIVRPPTTGTLFYRLWIDGRPTTQRVAKLTGVTAGVGIFMKLEFPVARGRHIRFQAHGDVSFAGMIVPTGQTLVRPTNPRARRTVVLGDSFTGGAQDVNRLETGPYLAAMILGADVIWSLGLGGTGYTATSNTFQTRTAATLAASPDTVIVMGSRNDGGPSSGALQTAVATLLTTLAAIPRLYISGPSTVGFAGNNSSVKAATTAANKPFLDQLGADAWIVESKHIDPVDNVHPNWAGSLRIGARLAEAIGAVEAP